MADQGPRHSSRSASAADAYPEAPQADAAAPQADAAAPQEAIYHLLVESVRDYAIFALDSTGHIITWNAGARRLKGYEPDEIIGRHFSIFYPEEAQATRFPDYELEVAAREGRFEHEGWRIRKDGSRFWANVVITALIDRDGKLTGFAKVTRDLTERRAAELRAIEDARRVAEAEAANRAKGEFLAAMSHELRTPLNAIGGYTDLIAAGIHGPVTPEQVVALDRIRASQRHLLGLINDLLNFSRIEAGRLEYDIAEVELAPLTQAVRAMIDVQASAKNISIDDAAVEPDVIALGDGPKIEQILLNLLVNAVKFTSAGGHIAISCGYEGDRAVVEVSDDGIGIPPEQIDSIFEPFVQVGRTLSTGHEGAGLGLAISRDLARAMDGELTVRSSVGAGSTFKLELPAG